MQQHCDIQPAAAPGAGAAAMRHSIRRRLGGRRGLLIGGAVLVAAGLALGWNWLTAVGAAPILIGLAPCLVMCALGLCMQQMTSRPGPGDAHRDADTSPSGAGGISAIAPSDTPPARKELAK